MTPIAIDYLPVVRAALAANGALAAACTGGSVASAYAGIVRIYGEELPDPLIVHSAIADVLPPTVIVAGAGGGGDPALAALARPRIELRTYDVSRARARALWYQALAVLLALPNRVSGGIFFQAGTGWSGPQTGNEPGGFPVCAGMIPLLVIGGAS